MFIKSKKYKSMEKHFSQKQKETLINKSKMEVNFLNLSSEFEQDKKNVDDRMNKFAPKCNK